jgi:hypothetical protein
VELRQRFELENLRSRMSEFSDQMGGISVQNKLSVCQKPSIDRKETSLVFCLTLTNPNATLGMKQIVPQPTHAWHEKKAKQSKNNKNKTKTNKTSTKQTKPKYTIQYDTINK